MEMLCDIVSLGLSKPPGRLEETWRFKGPAGPAGPAGHVGHVGHVGLEGLVMHVRHVKSRETLKHDETR